MSINTYGGKGVSGEDRSPIEVRAHTIAYDRREVPISFRGEEDMVKDPIVIDVNPGQTLDKASRLNFAKYLPWSTMSKLCPLAKSQTIRYIISELAEPASWPKTDITRWMMVPAEKISISASTANATTYTFDLPRLEQSVPDYITTYDLSRLFS